MARAGTSLERRAPGGHRHARWTGGRKASDQAPSAGRHRGHRPPGHRQGRGRGSGRRAGPPAVVNAAPSISGRYPNLGPEVLSRPASRCSTTAAPSSWTRPGGHPVPGRRPDLRTATDGRADRCQDATSVAERWRHARAGCRPARVVRRNTMEYLSKERDLLLDGRACPMQHRLRRPAGPDRRRAGTTTSEDLRPLRPYIREYRPVLIGVDGGATRSSRPATLPT
jgi:uncharacterized membrane-anchored protein